MTTERKTYRSTQPVREPIKVEEKVSIETREESGTSKFINITGLFRSSTGKSDKVRVSAEIAEKLHQIQEGDILGVSLNSKYDRLGLWYIPNNSEGTE